MTWQKEEAGRPIQVEQGTYPVTPDKSVGFFQALLEHPTFGDNQAVDGSSTPAEYEWTPDPAFGPQVLVHEFKVVVVATNISDFFDYANRAPLANGLVVESEKNTVVFNYATIINNLDFVRFSSEALGGDFRQSGSETQNGQALTLRLPVPVIADANFIYRVIVRDDLSVLSYQSTTVFFTTL